MSDERVCAATAREEARRVDYAAFSLRGLADDLDDEYIRHLAEGLELPKLARKPPDLAGG